MGYIYKNMERNFVASKQLKIDLYKFYDFTEEWKTWKEAFSKVLSFEIIPADKYVANF